MLRKGRGGVGCCRVGAPSGGVAEHGGTRGAVATIGAGKPSEPRALASRRPLLSAVVVCCCGPRMLAVVVPWLLSVVVYLSADVDCCCSLVIVSCGVFVRFY